MTTSPGFHSWPSSAKRRLMPGDVARDRARLERRRLRRLAELAALGVAEDAAEVLRLADDRGVGHAGQLVAHLDRDRVERAGDDGRGDRVDSRLDRAHRAPSFVEDQVAGGVRRRVPAGRDDGRGVEMEDDGGSGDRLVERQQVAVVEARSAAPAGCRRRGRRPRSRPTSASSRLPLETGSASSAGRRPIAVTRALTISIGSP